MLKCLFICLISIFSLSTHAQIVAIEDLEQNILYTCVENRLKIAVENCPEDLLVVSTDNGEIRKNEYLRGGYSIRPKQFGHATVYVGRKTTKGVKRLDSVYYCVKRIPPPHITLNGQTEGNISKARMRVEIAPSANIESFNFEARMLVKQYTVIVYRNNNEIFRRKNCDDNGRIDSVTRAFFDDLENNDKVIFTQFIVSDCSGDRTDVNSIELVVTDAKNSPKEQLRPEHGEMEIIDPVTGRSYMKKW